MTGDGVTTGVSSSCPSPRTDLESGTLERPDVSVVVLNYNGRSWLDRCLTSLAGQRSAHQDEAIEQGASLADPDQARSVQTDAPHEVILVDNGSSDGSVAFVAARFPWVRVVALERNVGFAAGNNAGARAARGGLLAFLNNDTQADPRWVAALTSALDSHPQAGLATSQIVYLDDPTLVDSAGDGYARCGGAFKRGHGQRAADYLDACEVFGACGAAFMIRREVFDELAGFDEDLFLVYEDVDLSYRAQLADYRCVYVPDAVVRHAGSATMGTVSRTSVFYGQRNLEWVYVKNTPRSLLLRTLPAHVLYSLAGGVYLATSGHLGTWFSAKWAALVGLPGMWRKRSAIQRSRRTTLPRLERLMDPGWLALKWREKRFDLAVGRRTR
jgi:hypothetical protein